jgi:hypothetical protein
LSSRSVARKISIPIGLIVVDCQSAILIFLPAACRVLCLAYRDLHLPAEALQPAGEWAGDDGSLTVALGSGSESDASLHAWDDCLCLADNLESNLTLVSASCGPTEAILCCVPHALQCLRCSAPACSPFVLNTPDASCSHTR